MSDARAVKDALLERVEELAMYLFPNGKREGAHWCVGDITGAPGNSFKICITGDKAGMWGDFADSRKHSPNLLDVWMHARNVDFKTALRECSDWLGTPIPRYEQREAQSRAPAAKQIFTDFLPIEECRRAVEMAVTLRNDPKLCERIANARGWKSETIRDLTVGPHLGWHEGKLAFIYETGVKLRWRQDGERIVRWAFGKPWLWRGSYINVASRVYLSEGETDAISLIDAGVELDERTVAVALPSASTFDERWAKLFEGKEVILVFDADKAGQDATRRLARLLQPHVASLKQLNWGGLQRAS
jgi:twinkle protein